MLLWVWWFEVQIEWGWVIDDALRAIAVGTHQVWFLEDLQRSLRTIEQLQMDWAIQEGDGAKSV